MPFSGRKEDKKRRSQQLSGADEGRVQAFSPHEKALGEGSIPLLLLRYSLPAVASYFISELYNMVDSYFLGNALGEEALAALGAVFPIQRLVIAFSLLFSFAASNLISLSFGRGRRDEAHGFFSAAVRLNVMIMVPYAVLIYVFRNQLLPLLGLRGTAIGMASRYVGIVIWGSLCLSLSTTLCRVLLVFGKNGLALLLTSCGAILNIILDAYFVCTLGLGMEGAAWATLLSQIGAFLLSAAFFAPYLKRGELRLCRRLGPALYQKVFAQGLPSFIVESEDAIVLAVLNRLFFLTAGNEGVAVLALNTKLYMFLFVLVLGFAYGMQILAAYNLGAGRIARVRSTLQTSALLSLFFTSAATLCFYLRARELLSLFVKEEAFIGRCLPCFRAMILLLPILVIYYTLVMFYQAADRARASILFSLLRQIMFLCPLVFLAVCLFRAPLHVLFYIYPLTDLLAAGLALFFLYKVFMTLRSE